MRAEKLYAAIIAVVDMDDVDKANLRETLHNLNERQLKELEEVYIEGRY